MERKKKASFYLDKYPITYRTQGPEVELTSLWACKNDPLPHILMAELQEVEVNSNCKHLIASINSYVCFLYLIMHTLLFKYYGSLKRRIMVDKRHVFGEFMVSLLCLGNKKKMCLFSEGKDQNRNCRGFFCTKR